MSIGISRSPRRPWRTLSAVVCAGAALLVGACATYQGYDGPKRSAKEVAIVSGDAKLRTQMPVALVIRQVDGRPVDVRYSAVALAPGKHELLIDCQVEGLDGSTSRHRLEVDVGAGERYRLRAQMQPGNRSCESVVMH